MAAMRVKRKATASAASHLRSTAKEPGHEKGEGKITRALKPTVSIIGVGRLGSALALALQACGYSIEAIAARRLSHAQRAARILDPPPTHVLSAARLEQFPLTDLTFITTPDDSISHIAAQLAARVAPIASGQTALHMSGALSSAVLRPLADVGYSIASLHPLISVSDSVRGAKSLRQAFYCVEGERQAVANARRIVRDFGAQSFTIGAEHKTLYHAAAVMASGHLVALFDAASGMLAQCGLSQARARTVLLPLVQSTIDNLSTHEPAHALTGSFARADVETIRRHLNALSAAAQSDELRNALEIYILLGARSLQLAQRNGASRAALKEISNALEEATRSMKQCGKAKSGGRK